MEDRRRTRSQGPPSPSEDNELIQWGSVQDPVRIEKEQAEARRIARQAQVVDNVSKNTVENSEIPLVGSTSYEHSRSEQQISEIPPKQQGHTANTPSMPRSGEISPKRQENDRSPSLVQKTSEIPPKESYEVTDLVTMEEGIAGTPHSTGAQNTYNEKANTQSEENQEWQPPQPEFTQHFLDDNFSDVMRSSAIGSNISSLFNITTISTTHNEQKVTLDWVLPDGKNSQLATKKEKHIADISTPRGNTGAMLVYLPELEPFYDTREFMVDLQTGELFVKLQNKWHPTGLTCRKRPFDVDQLMALIQHASIKLKNRIYRKKEGETAVLTLDPSKAQAPPLPFIPDTHNYVSHSKPMSPTMRKNYIKDRAQAAVTYITEYGNTRLWMLEKLVPTHKLTQRLQIIFSRVNAVKEAVDKAIGKDDEIRRKKCMRYLKPPTRFPVPEDMENEETATWISWVHLETQALIEDLNEEIKLQNDKDDPFTKNIMYAPMSSVQEGEEVSNHHVDNKISPNQRQEEKLASPLPVEGRSGPLPQRTGGKRSEIPPESKEPRDPRSKPRVYGGRSNNTPRQIHYDSWGGNDTSYLQIPTARHETVLEQFSINDTTDIRICYRCGGEGHIKKFCGLNVHFDFCKSYSHHTSVCRSYVNFVKSHPVASSRSGTSD